MNPMEPRSARQEQEVSEGYEFRTVQDVSGRITQKRIRNQQVLGSIPSAGSIAGGEIGGCGRASRGVYSQCPPGYQRATTQTARTGLIWPWNERADRGRRALFPPIPAGSYPGVLHCGPGTQEDGWIRSVAQKEI